MSVSDNASRSPDFRKLFESAPGLYLVLDPRLVIIGASDAYLKATMTQRDQVLGHGIFEIFPDNPNDPSADGVRNLRASLNRVLLHRVSDPMPVQKYDIRKPVSEGGAFEVRYWSPVNSPVFAENGELLYIIHRVEDVTEFIRLKQLGTEQEKLTEEFRVRAQRMEAEVYDRERQLEEANRNRLESIGRLAGGVAHDFNNLLGVITGCAELLGTRIDDSEPNRRLLASILQAAEKAATLTRQLLAYSLQQVLEPRVVDLNAIVEKIQPFIQRLIGESIDFQVSPDPSLVRTKADPGQIEQVIMNLAINAREAMSEGGRLIIRTSNVLADEAYLKTHPGLQLGPYVLLSVSDTGMGIDQATRSRIFEPFFTTKGRAKGTGLGLSTVYGIVTQSGGSVEVDSSPGKGSTFSVYLPATNEGEKPRHKTPQAKPRSGGKQTILLVEDQALLGRVVHTMLEQSGYNVLLAATPAEGLHKAETHAGKIDLLITDMILPGMNGRILAEKMKELRPQLKVLFVSGYAENVVSEDGYLAPGMNFLQKPFTHDSLSGKVREVLDQF